MKGEGTHVETDSRAGFGADVGACGRELLCTAEPVVPDAQASYVRMTGYADLDRNAEITAIDVL